MRAGPLHCAACLRHVPAHLPKLVPRPPQALKPCFPNGLSEVPHLFLGKASLGVRVRTSPPLNSLCPWASHLISVGLSFLIYKMSKLGYSLTQHSFTVCQLSTLRQRSQADCMLGSLQKLGFCRLGCRRVACRRETDKATRLSIKQQATAGLLASGRRTL